MPSTFNDIIDGVSTSLAVKAPVRVASTTHLALSGLVVVEGVQTTEDMRILVNAQNDAVDNGIYTVKTGAWQRAKDFDGARDAAYGTTVFSAENSKFYRLITPNPVVIGTDDIHWVVTILSEEAGELQIIDNVADLRLTIAAADGQTIGLAGYYEPGDAPFRTVMWDAASTTTDDGGRVFQVTGVATGRWKSTIVDFMDIRLWGAKLDDTTDDYEVWNRALNSTLRIQPEFFNTKHAGTFLFPDVGVSYVSQTIHAKSVFHLKGNGGHLGLSQSCVIRNPVDVGGIVTHHYNTDSSGTVANGSTSETSVIEGITFRGGYYPSSTGTLGHGIWMRTRTVLRNVIVWGYAQNGVHIYAVCGGGGFIEGNANNWYMESVRSQRNGGHGIYTEGDCANAGVGIDCHADDNGGYGIYESTFLGNTWIQCHTAGNTLSGYKADNLSGANVFLGCYTESDQPPSEFTYPTLIIGGLHGAGISATSTGVYLSNGLGFLRNSRGYENPMTTTGGDDVTMTLGGDANNGDVLKMYHELYAASLHRLHYVSSGDLDFDYANTSTNLAFRITGPSTAAQFGTGVAVPHTAMFPKIALGSTAAGFCRLVTYGSAAPTTGAHAQGEIVFSTIPAAGGFVGWVCTTGGTPGTWKTWGAISA